jgi:hypothetical protein
MHLRFKVKPPRTWYYRVFPNFHTLKIFLKVGPIFNDEFQIICKGFFEIEDTSILHGFQSLALDTIIGYMVYFIDFFLITRQII